VESPVGAVAHSDGDVVLHALIDALLGALGTGQDIGDRYPPSEAAYKDAASAQLLSPVVAEMQAAGWQVAQVDVTVFLEKPKLAGYKMAIRARLAQLLEMPEAGVCVKAKTMEGLGAIGAQQAVAASVLVLLMPIPGQMPPPV
jgi:2-C-methyl-D-erythritol 2,4-cyclodiphosphate synthase